MRFWLFSVLFLLFLIPMAAVRAEVVDEALPLFRSQHYDYTSNGIYVNRSSASTTSETLGYAAMLECRLGDLGACYGILRFADATFLGREEDYTFPWLVSRSGSHLRGREGATDGDLSLVWAAWAAYNRTGDSVFLDFYVPWEMKVRELDVCVSNGQTYLASGSGIGRWNGCDSFNGVYAAYLMLPLLADLADFDQNWIPILEGTVKESYEIATLSGNVFPNRCSAYQPGSLNTSACELHTGYFDPLDAQRWVFWNGIYCSNYYGTTANDAELCNHLATLPGYLEESKVPSNGFWLNGTPRGSFQTNTYDIALWSPLVQSNIALLESDWNGEDFDGTPCPGNCVDEFKDALIMMALAHGESRLFPNSSSLPFILENGSLAYNGSIFETYNGSIVNETYIPSIIDTYSPYYANQQNEISGNETLIGFTYEEIDHKKNLLLTVVIPLVILASVIFAFMR